MCKIGIIYKIKNKINEKEYIGCTINTLKKRIEEHVWRCLNSDSNSKFCNSLRKYGIENFESEILEECDVKEIYSKEKKYIEKYETYTKGLNSTLGEEGCLGYKHSEDIRKKISYILKDGRSHKGKNYQEIYGVNFLNEIEKRSNSVKKMWKKMDENEKKIRFDKSVSKSREKSKYGESLIKEIKNKFKEGLKVKEVLNLYPFFNESYLYAIKNNKRWKNI
jgi:group I intron endonuclease